MVPLELCGDSGGAGWEVVLSGVSGEDEGGQGVEWRFCWGGEGEGGGEVKGGGLMGGGVRKQTVRNDH